MYLRVILIVEKSGKIGQYYGAMKNVDVDLLCQLGRLFLYKIK